MNHISHYEEPLAVYKKASISHFEEKYDRTDYYGQRSHRGHSFLRSSKSLGCLSRANDPNILLDPEISQIETFFRAHKTFVFAGRCLANLYFTKTDITNGGRISKPRIHEWELFRTGIPVIIFDKGETKARDKRLLQICLAERGSGFVLWKDVIDNLSDYSAHHECFHTLYLSSDHRKMAGLSFDSSVAAKEFLEQIEGFTSDPLNIALTGPKKVKKKLLKRHLSFGWPALSKMHQPKLSTKDISTPCFFQHVTSVDLADHEKLYSVSTLVPHLPNVSASPSPPAVPTQSAVVRHPV